MASILDIDMNVPEPEAVEADEYRLRIADAVIRQQNPEKGSSEFLMLTLEIQDQPNAKLVNHVIMIPNDDGSVSEKDNNNRQRSLKYLVQAFSLDPGFMRNVGTCVGATGDAILKIEESDEWGRQNRVARFVVPQG